MGVPGPLIEIFLHEHRYRPWRGRLLTLGRQKFFGRRATVEGPAGGLRHPVRPGESRL
jgi:hypothetical protein